MPRSPYNVSTGSKLIVTLYKHLIVPCLVHKAIMRLFFFKLQIDCCWILKGLGNVFKWFVIQSMVCIGVWTNSAKVLGTFSATFFFFLRTFCQVVRRLIGRGVVSVRTGGWLCGFTHAWSHNVTVQTWLETWGSSPSPISDSKPPPKTKLRKKLFFAHVNGPGTASQTEHTPGEVCARTSLGVSI